MKLSFNNEGIFEPHKIQLKEGKPLIYSINKYISKYLMLKSMGLCHVTHYSKFSLFRVLNQQSLNLYQSISSLN